MPTAAFSRDRSTPDSTRNSPSQTTATATRPNTRRNGPPTLIEEHQDIKNLTEGRKFLEKHSLLCPPGEPSSHQSLSTCLHQIAAMAGLQKMAINAIRSVAFLLEEMEDTQINEVLRSALDSHMTELTSDMKMLVEDAKEKIDAHVKASEERLSNIPAPMPTQNNQQAFTTGTYVSILVNPPAHANPKVAAKEGIKARQFLIEGIRNSKLSHLDTLKLKAELNKFLTELNMPTGKIRSITSSRGGGTIIEADSDAAAHWLSDADNQRKLCDVIGSNTEFRSRTYNIIAFNVPTDINPDEANHRQEINEVNDLEASTITATKWAKAIDRRSPNQRTAHLLLTFNNANAANRAIANGLTICNKRCRVERTKREPSRCLKCQGWNHFAKDCIKEKSSCANCAQPHRTDSCLAKERRCVSCKSDDHTSWSRTCPTFTRKCDEFNLENPENSLQFFPTTDPWTWTTTERSPPSQTPVPKPQNRPSQVQLGKRPQQPRKPTDSYVPNTNTNRPTDTYIPNGGSRSGDSYVPTRQGDTYIPTYDPYDWGKDPGPSGSRSNPVVRGSSVANEAATQAPSSTQNSNRPVNPAPITNA
jgi:hypothetical protein